MSPSGENLSIRETHYITQYLPYYNVLKQGYSSLGYKHTHSHSVCEKKLKKCLLN